MTAEIWRAVILALTGGAALGIGKVIWGFIARGLKRDLKAVVEEVVDQKLEPIRELAEQLVPNGGSSLRDAIDRIERRLTEVEHDLHDQ